MCWPQSYHPCGNPALVFMELKIKMSWVLIPAQICCEIMYWLNWPKNKWKRWAISKKIISPSRYIVSISLADLSFCELSLRDFCVAVKNKIAFLEMFVYLPTYLPMRSWYSTGNFKLRGVDILNNINITEWLFNHFLVLIFYKPLLKDR